MSSPLRPIDAMAPGRLDVERGIVKAASIEHAWPVIRLRHRTAAPSS